MDRSDRTASELIQTGWRLATITGGDHLERALRMYAELGFSTTLVEMNPAEQEQCTLCYQSSHRPLFKIYTMSPQDSGNSAVI